jgi:hypothetical protein
MIMITKYNCFDQSSFTKITYVTNYMIISYFIINKISHFFILRN